MTTEPMRRGVRLVVAAVVLSSCSVAPQGSPPAVSGSATPIDPVPSPAASPAPVGRIEPYPGWTELARIDSADTAHRGEAIATGPRPETLRHLLVSVACTGSGTVTISIADLGETEKTVDCESTVARPDRTMPYVGSDPNRWEVRAVPSGAIDFEVLIEGAEIPLHLPQVRLASGREVVAMPVGCLSISLAWGYDAGDLCGTTLPSEPIPTIRLDRGSDATLSVDDWTITVAGVACGRVRTAPDSPDEFVPVLACAIRARRDGTSIRISGFPTSALPWLLEVDLAAQAQWGDSFRGPAYAWVSVP